MERLRWLPEKATKLAAVRGRVLVWIRASTEEIDLAVPPPGKESGAPVTISDRGLVASSDMTVSVSGVNRTGGTLKCTLKFQNVDPRMLKNTFQLWHLTDDKGRRYPGQTWSYPIDNDPKVKTYGVQFVGIPEDATPALIRVRIPRRVVALEVPFDLKDIPVR